jgi:hypothetical protein
MGLLASVTACAHHAKPVAYAEGPTGKDAYVFGFFTTQGAGGEQPDDARTMGLRFDCIAAGVRTPDFCMFQVDDLNWGAASLFARGGYASVQGGRGIDNCVDCDGTTFALQSGAFLESGLHLGIKRTNRLGITFDATYRRYLGDASLLDDVQLGAGFWYW